MSVPCYYNDQFAHNDIIDVKKPPLPNQFDL